MSTIYVDPPLRLERKGGIRSVVEFRPGERLTAGVRPNFTPDPCDFTLGSAALCYASAPGDDQKTALGIDVGQSIGETFGVYAAEQCFMGPGTRNTQEYRDRASMRVEQGRDRLIEGVIYDWMNAASAIVPAPDSVVAAIGALDQKADAELLGGPIIWMSRIDAVAAVAASALIADPEAGRLWTPNGNPVVATSAIPAGSFFATGGVTVLHSEIVARDTIHPTENTEIALAEQAFAVLVDCDYRLKAVVA